MVVNITGGDNACEQQPCVKQKGIRNFTQATSIRKVMISYMSASRISFALRNLKAVLGKEITGMFGKIWQKVFFTHLFQLWRSPARIAVLVDQGRTHALIKIMTPQYLRAGGKFPFEAFDEAGAFPPQAQQLQG